MIFQALAPSTEVFAQELDAVMEASVFAARAAGNTARSVQDAVATALENADQATSDDAATTPGADAGATEGGNGSTNADGSQDSTTDGTTGGDTSAEGDASQDGTTADEGAADEEQTDDEDADAAAQANVTYAYNTVDELKTAIGESKITTGEDGAVTQIEFNESSDLIKISQTKPSVYQNAVIIKGGLSGASFDLSGSNDFQGFGDDSAPFKGSLDLKGSTLAVKRTLFNNIWLTDANSTVAVAWKGADAQPIVAEKITGNGQTLNAAVTVSSTNSSANTMTLASPLLGEVSGDLTLDATYATDGNKPLAVNISSDKGNIGLLVNTVASDSFTINKLEGLPATYEGRPTIKTTDANASAGGIIGLCEDDVTVSLTSPIDLSKFTVIGKAASGGLIGKATKLKLGSKNAKFTCPANVGDTNSENVGGFIGEVSFAKSVEFTGNDQIDTGDGVTLAGKSDESKGVGATIGKLNYDSSTAAASASFFGGTFKSAYGNGGAEAVFGGLVGSVTGYVYKNKTTGEIVASVPLRIENVTTEFELESSPRFTGGLVGWLGRGNNTSASAALEVKSAKVGCKKLTQSGKGFGGVAGCIDNASVADINGVTVINEGAIENGAGVAAESWGSAIRLGGVTDFSGMRFAPEKSFTGKKSVAQIANVSAKNPTLVFARGTGSDNVPADANNNGDYWVYRRCPQMKIDDLGSDQNADCGYGEVIKLDDDKLPKNLIQINMIKHELEGPSTSDWSWQVGSQNGSWSENNRTLTINTTQDFVCLALSVQFASLWNGVYGLNPQNKAQLLYSDVKIELASDVDLSGTGVTGIGFDSDSNLQTFQGTFNGNNHTITLAIGEPYGIRDNNDTSAGNGKIYRHSRLGLFPAIGGGATVKNLTINGVMNFDNGLAVDAGSLAATITGNATLSGVTCESTITCDDTFGNDANIGGIAGSMMGAGIVTFDSSNTSGNTKAQTNINADTTLKGNTRIGGAIGYVGDAAVTVKVSGLTVGGSIVAGESASSKKIAQVGGFIGCIAQGEQSNVEKKVNVKAVNITGLLFDSFKMAVGQNGDKRKGAGGLLGYSWGNANVTIGDTVKNDSNDTYALKANNAKITADKADELGGLVYAASGHWIIDGRAIDLSGATINASAATTLGVLVGRGCKVNDTSTYGVEKYAGLYLEDKAYWGTAYRVEGIAITAPKVATFDEWVGSGVKPDNGSKLMDADWNTVVSLHTEGDMLDDTLDMSGNPANDNSYKNRSTFGQSHNTNGNTRYYYNLDRAYTKVGQGNSAISLIDTAEKLLLWSAYRYAPDAIRLMIVPQAFADAVTIGGGSGKSVVINLAGYSYYPTQPNGKVTVNNATITFHYSVIKAEQKGNKLNSEATQHENMHCGLFRTVANGDLTVKTVTLGGTIGPVINDRRSKNDITAAGGSSSGALVCRYVYGSSNGTTTTIRKISIEDLTLNNLTVDGASKATGADAYMPLLINEMQTYVNLNAKNITTTGYDGATKAGTSLFGKLGVGSAADQVTATFNRISVPSASDNTIFTRASLLESFGYGEGKTGSAVYTFIKADQSADQSENKVTFGSEIDSKGEYSGKQLWYYDEDTYEKPAGLVTVDDKWADKDNPQFGGYLPYVNKGKTNEDNVQYHEIKVNQRVPKLTVGCGTYGDPYAITKASELNTVAEYINTQIARDGWEVTIVKDQGQLCQRRNGNSTENEITYVYKQANAANKKWEKKDGDTTVSSDTLDDDTMRRYLQSAYYSIEPVDNKGESTGTLELDTADFQGLGNKGNPFRGVIVGNLRGSSQATTQATIKINNSKDTGALSGLIPYSYGSVVSNLNIEYSGNAASIAHKNKDTASGVPNSFFGGVIGCIMGGDNIIDGVLVNATGGFSVAGAAGDKGAYLVPIGGYVGAITGGGVIFRNSSNVSGAPNSWHNEGSSLYDNPYVGRVIDGYAFSEGCIVDNGDASYKINRLETHDAHCIETGETQGHYRGDSANSLAITTTVNDSQGLLVLSAIISSGAAGGSANTTAQDNEHATNYGTYAGSNAYLGGNTSTNKKGYKFGNQNYGKVRNANYEAVGQPASATDDFSVAIKDDMLSPGSQNAAALDQADGNQVNSPYLVSKYATWQTGNICAAQVSGMDLQFKAGETFDMTPYSTGYTGLSGRYYSNACASNKGADRDRIVPLVATINGNGATIRVGSNGSDERDNGEKNPYDIQEYADDDYKLTGVGALFGTVTYTSENVSESIGTPATDGAVATGNSGYTVQNLNFYDCNISLRYVSYSEIATVDNNIATVATDSANEVGVGLLAGTTANASSLENYGKYSTVDMTNSRVEGPSNVGGMLGASGYGSRKTDKSDTTFMVNQTTKQPSPVKLYDCSYSGMTVLGIKNVGGFVGKLNSKSQGGVWTTSDMDIAKDSVISSTGSSARVGGVLGVNGDLFCVNVNPDSADKEVNASGIAAIKNVKITAVSSEGVGGLIGKVENSVYAHGLNVLGSDSSTSRTTIGAAGLESIGGIAGFVTDGDEFKFDACKVKNIDLSSKGCSGGIIGQLKVASKRLICNEVELRGMTLNGNYSGGIFGNLQYLITSPSSIEITNSVIAEIAISGQHSGGISGDGKGIYKLVNVLIDSNKFNTSNKQGVLFGDTATNAMYALYAAGLDVKPGEGKSNKDLPALMNVDWNNKAEDVNKKSYIAFGDYKDTLTVPDTTLFSDETNEDGSQKTVEAASPYVTTSPVSSIAVRSSANDTIDRHLFGDGANVGTAATIKTQAGTNVTGRYTYNNIGGRNDAGVYQNTAGDFNTKTSVDKYNSNNSGESKQVADGKDFDVLVLSGGDTTTVESYLNIVTNGGYSDARLLNPATKNGTEHVTATTEVFTLDASRHFVKDATATPTISVRGNGTSTMSFSASGTDWDNEKGRFILLTVTFTEAGQSYKVQVPIIVKRMLETNFTATYVEGSNFKAANYSERGKDAHVLISSGESMTGLLTWTYNQAYGTATEYGWNTYLASGGAMKPLQKEITFKGDKGKGTLPKGTQLTLVDKANNNKEYHYTVPDGGATSVKLTDFKDAAGVKYVEPWLSETAGVTVSDTGTWVVAVSEAEATVKVGSTYYRPKTDSDARKPTFKLSVPNEKPVSESFYLVVRTPSGSAGVNGWTATAFGNSDLNTRINYTLRPDNSKDGNQNTASTYSIASNYTHNLVDDSESGTKQMQMRDTTYPLEMEVHDTISFGAQEYTSSDALYYQLDSSLVNYEDGVASGAHGYPTGTRGTYSFYVKVGNNCYTWNGSGWDGPVATETPVVADAKEWSSTTGGDMSLVLADANGKPIDLSGIREKAKANGSEFTITMVAHLTMTEPACQAGISASQDNGSDKYTKPNYRAYLSTHADTLSTSSNSAYSDGNTGYYRADVGSSTIALEASKKSQLGINIDDLKSADGEIALVGTYDFSKLTGADAMISSATKVTYTLSLQQRKADGTYDAVNDISKYITVLGSDKLGAGALSANGNSYVFTDSKGTDGTFATRYENSLAFKHTFLVKVNTDVEGKSQFYANYRLVLTAHMSGDGVNDTPVNANNLDGYLNSDYVTYTLARINTKGIQHGSTTN